MKQKVFNGALNRDIAPRFLKEEDYVGASNIIFQTSKDGNAGILRRYPGFSAATATSGTALPANPETIGAFENRATREVYFFVAGSDFDGVFKYSPTPNTFTKVIVGDLNFSTLYRITGVAMIGNLLFWTDNLNEPRAINVTRDYTSFTNKEITIIKPAPRYPLTFSFVTDAAATYSLMTGKIYDFSYRYIYPDNQFSVIAPYLMQVYCAEQDPLITGIELIRVPYAAVPDSVEKVELLVRRSDQDNWQIFSTLTRSEFVNTTPVFKDDVFGKTVPLADTIKYFESAPVKSKSLEVARDRVFLGNNTEGYDLYSIPSLIATLESSDTSSEVKSLPVYIQNITTLEQDYQNGFLPEEIIYTQTIETNYYLVDGGRYYFFKEGSILVYQEGQVPNPTETRPSQYTGSETTFTVDYDNFVTHDDLNYTQTTGTQGQGAFYTYTQSTTSAVNPEHLISTTINLQGSVGATKFKNNSQYQIGIVFYDEYLRNSGVYTNDYCSVTINDDFRNSDVSYLKWEVDPSDNLNIPIWARSYQIVRTDNLTKQTFIQGKTSDIYWVRDFEGAELYDREYTSEAKAIEIDVTGSFKGGLRYSFTEGDLIDIELPIGIRTYQITGAVGSRIRIAPISNAYFETAGGAIEPVRFFYEIYRLKQRTSEQIFYEVGASYRIAEEGTESRAFTVTSGYLPGDVEVVSADHYDYPDNRTITSGVFSTNDLSTTVVTITVEAGNIKNDSTVGWLKRLGRLNAILDVGQTVKETAVRWSNRFIQGTKVNGTSSFEVNDEKQLSIEVGEINKLQLTSKAQQEGTVMLAICRNECVSMYLGETQIVDNVNQALLGSTVQVIGTVNVLNSGAGTIHPESVMHHNGRVWWWDFYNSRVLRYDPNGIRDLSELGMKSYFYGKGNPTVGYDPFHNLFFIGFGSDMLSFDENANQWRCFHTFTPQYTSKVEDFMISFHGGIPWKSNQTGFVYPGGVNTTFYEFYISFPNPQILDNISIEATEVYTWANAKQNVADLFDVLATNESGQETGLIFSDFDVIESVLYAHFFRDKNSAGGLRGGEVMRGDLHKFKITIKGDIGFETITINDTQSSGHL
jgi:hypothetical protein